MSGRLIRQRFILILAAVALVALVTVAVVLGFAALLGGMGDEIGSRVLRWVAGGVSVVLVVDLICLILALAVHAATNGDEPPDEGG